MARTVYYRVHWEGGNYRIYVLGPDDTQEQARGKAEKTPELAIKKHTYPEWQRIASDEMEKIKRKRRPARKLTATQAVRKERHEATKKQESERGRRLAKLDRYNIDFTYIKGGDTAKRSAVGYRDMRQVRSETWKSTRKHKGGRAYRVETVNVTKGRKVK